MQNTDRVKDIIIGMLAADDAGLNEFEKILKYETVARKRNDIRHDMDIAEYLKKNGKEDTPIIPIISEMRSAMVLQTVIFGMLG